jgi:RNA polymerase sigma factor (sigma-70 family)
MSFQNDFSELKRDLEIAIKTNPILSKGQEHFIFANITSVKNKIFAICLKERRVYSEFLSIVEEYICDKNAHEVFVMKKSSNHEIELDRNVNFVHSIKSIEFADLLNSIRSYDVSFDVYKRVFSSWKEVEHSKDFPIIEMFERELDYGIEKIILSNIKMVLRITSTYRDTENMSVKDVFSEGMLGVRRAVEKFNLNLGFKFSTYSSQWIKAEINRAIANKDALIRKPVNIIELRKEAEKTKKALKASLGRDPSNSEIVANMKNGRKVDNIEDLNLSFSYHSFSATHPDDSSTSQYSMEDSLQSEHISIEDEVTVNSVKSVLSDMMTNALSEKERYYVMYHFGLNSESVVKSKEEMLTELGVNSNEYNTIRKKAMMAMKRVVSNNSILREAYASVTDWP